MTDTEAARLHTMMLPLSNYRLFVVVVVISIHFPNQIIKERRKKEND